ncbi:hypothetical protein [Treponema peruense]|uniref:Ribbon-helix-helix protein, copG family n=1 Tax=Treponema peruense TaxID=2787628 RepID=A0A7T3REM2_9SPIR|nr:hypothetical protein [Treponema peruense]QQA01680.1 hypothetical protein IWA51_03455 [Treponema peruense]
MPKKNGVWEKICFDELKDKHLRELAEEKGISKTQVLENALDLYYSQDVMPEHIVLGRMTQVQQKLELMDRKLETLAGIFYSIMPYIIGVLPPLPKNEVNAKGEKYNPALDKGNDVFNKLVINYRKQMQAHKISFMQNVWADMQEEIFFTHYGTEGKDKIKVDIGERTAGN